MESRLVNDNRGEKWFQPASEQFKSTSLPQFSRPAINNPHSSTRTEWTGWLRSWLPSRIPNRRVLLGLSGCLIIVILAKIHFTPWQQSHLSGSSPAQSNDPIHLGGLPPIYGSELPNLVLPASLLTFPLLATRLHAFLSRPILSHHQGIQQNSNRFERLGTEESCPYELSDQLVNSDQLKGEGKFWREDITTDLVIGRRVQVVRWLADWATRGDAILGVGSGAGSGQGIVMTGGNGDTRQRLLTTLRMLRDTGCSLPIEIFYFPDELTDENERAELEAFNAVLKEIKHVEKAQGVWKNWQIKGLAIIQSSFQEIIYLDSDVVPLRSLTHLFTSPTYTATGAAFWPDLSKDHTDNAIWRIVGNPCTLEEWTFESGQMVIDKGGNDGLNLAALIVAAEMQKDREFWFKMCGGDKDTYRWAWRILGLDYGLVERWMGVAGFMDPNEGRFCGHSVVQYDLDPYPGSEFGVVAPLFLHGTLLKHLVGYGLERETLLSHVVSTRPAAGSLKVWADPQLHFRNSTITSPHLNHAHTWVYNSRRGMCLSSEWHESAQTHLSAKEREAWGPQMLDITGTDLESGQTGGHDEEEAVMREVFQGFVDTWWEAGGRTGY